MQPASGSEIAPTRHAGPYAPLTPAQPLARVMARGWSAGPPAPVPMKVPVDWSRAGTEDRSWAYHLMALDMIDPLLVAHAETGDIAPLNLAIDITLDWWATVDGTETEDGHWYDMAVGQRAWRVSYALGAARRAGVAESSWPVLEALLAEHERRLLPDAAFTAGSNHGFFQAAGLRAIAAEGVARDAETAAIATDRLRTILATHFTADGVHREHSPDYHWFMLVALKALQVRGLADGDVGERIDIIARALGWFVKADGRLANFGDSDNRLLSSAQIAEMAPETGFGVFADGGYAVARTSAGGFLAQTFGQHSRVHKQADDLSVIWRTGGRDVLIDAGRLKYGALLKPDDPLRRKGFRYADPRRIYCESIQAHNTLEIEGARDRRLGPDRGSALVDAATADGLVATLCRINRPPFVHSRLIVGDPDAWLVIVDGLAGSWRRPAMRQWFHWDPEWTFERDGDGFVARAGGSTARVRPLTPGAALGPIIGRPEPDLQGWWSPKGNRFEPAPAIAFQSRRRVMATAVSLDEFGSTFDELGMNGRLQGSLRLRLADGRRVAVACDGRLSLDVEGPKR